MSQENATPLSKKPSVPSAISSTSNENPHRLTREELLEAMDEDVQLIRDGVIRVPANDQAEESNKWKLTPEEMDEALTCLKELIRDGVIKNTQFKIGPDPE